MKFEVAIKRWSLNRFLNNANEGLQNKIALDSDSSGTIGRRTVTEKSSLTDEQISEIFQQIEFKIASKVKDEIRETENTILRALGSLSENSLNGDMNNLCVGTKLGSEENSQDYLESYGLDSDQESVIFKSVFAEPPLDVHDSSLMWFFSGRIFFE